MTPTLMKALRPQRPGGSLTLKDVPVPEVHPVSVLVRIEVPALMSYLKAYVDGKLPFYNPPKDEFTIGTNGVGIVTAVGRDVAHIKPGARVLLDEHDAGCFEGGADGPSGGHHHSRADSDWGSAGQRDRPAQNAQSRTLFFRTCRQVDQGTSLEALVPLGTGGTSRLNLPQPHTRRVAVGELDGARLHSTPRSVHVVRPGHIHGGSDAPATISAASAGQRRTTSSQGA